MFTNKTGCTPTPLLDVKKTQKHKNTLKNSVKTPPRWVAHVLIGG
jgi:hypothetical protein